MSEIYAEPVGTAILTCSIDEIPEPNEFIVAFDGYRFYRADIGMYAIEE